MSTDHGRTPFRPAKAHSKRAKIFFWGDSGSGKTTTALQFPGVAVLDMEGGTDHYATDFTFDVLSATTADEVMAAVDWLLTHRHPYRTLVLDPITVYWDALQYKWSDIFLKRNKGSKGFKHEFYDLQPRDWMVLKSEFKELIRKLIRLDMNVIVTARQKALYADSGFMKKIGETFDGEKSLPYLFDTIVRLQRDEKGRFLGQCLKDRANKLPKGEFEVSYALFERCFGRETLDRESAPVVMVSDDQKTSIHEAIAALNLDSAKVTKRLASYGAATVDDLTEEAATEILSKLEAARRPQSTPTNGDGNAEG